MSRIIGFPPAVRATIIQRAERICERCGLRPGTEAHHRRPRGMGGTLQTSTNGPSNGLWLCGDCHRWTEANRTEALIRGFLVRQTGDPAEIPVLYRGSWVRLDDLGNLTTVAA